jgi:hypothetical protein
MRKAGCVAHMEQKRAYAGNKRVILKCVVNMMGVVCGMVRVAWDVPVADFCEHGNEFWVP